MMKPKRDLIVNSVCFLLLSPFFGMMVAGMVVGALLAILWVIAVVSGFVASLFFDMNLASLSPRMEVIKTYSSVTAAVLGSVGGIMWGWKEVKEHWEKNKIDGSGW